MKVFVVGAHGQIGTLLLPELQRAGYSVFAGIRKKAQASVVEAAGATPVLIDLLGPVADLAHQFQDMDAVVFAAGSGGSTGADMTLLVDLDGAAKTVEAVQMAGVRRFLIVSSAASDKRATWGDTIRSYMAAKYYADQQLRATDLNYTIIRPGGLTDEAGTSRYFIGNPAQSEVKTIARADVAHFIATAIGVPSTYRQEYDIFNGASVLGSYLQ